MLVQQSGHQVLVCYRCGLRSAPFCPEKSSAAMASASLMNELCKELSCPVCLKYFRDPMMLCCGHNFCQVCLAQYWSQSAGTGAGPCPECRKPVQPRGEAWPNWQLANVAHLVKVLWGDRRSEGLWFECEQHQRPLKFFCKDDQDSLCATCKRTKRHKGHSIVLMEAVVQEYKEKIRIQMQPPEEKTDKRVD